MRLGEALVKEGLLTKQQLEQGLKRQKECWGRIGTNMIELHFLKEEEVSMFLSKLYKLPAVSPEALNSIPEEVINCINKETAEKYMVLPFRKVKNKLHTAMLNPRDISHTDEISFVTGLNIIPYVITELRLKSALYKYYGIKGAVRYSLTGRFEPDTKSEALPADKIKTAFAEIMGIDELSDLLIKESYKSAKRVALFIVKDGKVKGWKAGGFEVDKFEIISGDSPIFSEVIRRGVKYRGPITDIKGNEPLIKMLSVLPQDAIILPIKIRGKTFALLYADNGVGFFSDSTAVFLSAMALISTLAFEIVILRNKILDFTLPS
ncbi:MAG: hypothetical protein A2X59_11850 [Nitrospirae bacterium GWC2_42_7]|nr:MAG: hypothetical protein A2X59_11850 [Nitrospirae bacterium GWC2_42_7]